MTTLGDMGISVTPHGSLNSSCGVISEFALVSENESDIQIGLSDQGVTSVRRISICRDGKLIPTKHLILTFHNPTLPSFVTAGHLRCPVRPYVPNPLRCFKCQRFGHSQTSCREACCMVTPSAPLQQKTIAAVVKSTKTCGVQTNISVSPSESLTRHAKCLLIANTQSEEKENTKTKTSVSKSGVTTRNLGSKKASKNPLNKQRVKAALSKSKKSEAQSMSEFSDISDEEANMEVTQPTSPPKGKSSVKLKRDTFVKNAASTNT
ncbi:uncharacterized protein [Centruroides vittatus]|uniref:uncharacterized protein n=1 Tax=Centruroides vittatus TaxID=120091 RepID=UPI00350F58ED